jgi:hypothetical protein
MSDQNMTRREAVKIGGASLAGVGLSAGASGVRFVEAAPAPATDYPDFRGKIVYVYLNEGDGTRLFAGPVVENQAGRAFLIGKVPAYGGWTDGLVGAVTWDSVRSYILFDSIEDYLARCKPYKNQKEEKSEPSATADGGGM